MREVQFPHNFKFSMFLPQLHGIPLKDGPMLTGTYEFSWPSPDTGIFLVARVSEWEGYCTNSVPGCNSKLLTTRSPGSVTWWWWRSNHDPTRRGTDHAYSLSNSFLLSGPLLNYTVKYFSVHCLYIKQKTTNYYRNWGGKNEDFFQVQPIP